MSKRQPNRLPRWHEWAVYWSAGLILLTGIGWLLLDRWVRVAGEFGPAHHPAQHLTLIAHAIGAYAFLTVIGALIPVHIPLGWRRGVNRVSGTIVVALCAVLALSGLGLYYFGGELARSWASLVHWTVGLAAAPALVIHAMRGRRTPLIIQRRAGSPRRRGRPTPAG